MAKKKTEFEYPLNEVYPTIRALFIKDPVGMQVIIPTIAQFVHIKTYDNNKMACDITSPSLATIYITFNKDTYFMLPLASKEDYHRFESFINVLTQAADVGIKMLSSSVIKNLGLSL